jgi:hypothetical protein
MSAETSLSKADLAMSPDLLFSPPVDDFSLLKVDQFDEVVEAGYVHGT